MQHYRYTHTRYTADKGTVLAHDVGTASGLTAEEVKHRVIGRFALQAWNSWICLPDGTLQRTHASTAQCPYIGSLILRPMRSADLR